MKKKIKLSIVLRCAGLILAVLAAVFFILSFNVKRDIQGFFLFSSVAFISAGVFCFFIGQLFRENRSKRNVAGMLFLAAGVTFLLLSSVLMFGILITLFFGVKSIWIYIDFALLVLGFASVLTGCLLVSSAK